MSEHSLDMPPSDTSQQSKKEYVSRRGRRTLGALIAILIIILLLSVVALLQLIRPSGVGDDEELGGVTWIRSIYGYGPDVSQMIEPASVAVTPEGGDLWVTDQVRYRLVRFDGATGNFIEEFGGETDRDDLIRYPSNVKVARDGGMIVAESTYDVVRIYDEEGALQRVVEVPSPLSLAINDEMFLVGSQAGFSAYTREGELMGIVGTRGQKEGQFDGVNGVALDDENNAYVVDSFNNRISKFDPEGFLVWEIKSGPPGNQAFGSMMSQKDLEKMKEQYPALMQVPMGATIDAAGRLVVVDLLDFSIAAFDTTDGSFLGKWGAYGQKDGQFAYPADIQYDEDFDWYVVADSGNRRAQVIRLPDSGGGGEAAMRRLLGGPLRACCLPLLLLLIILVLWVVVRRRRAERERAADTGGAVTVASQDAESSATGTAEVTEYDS